jgi:NADH-quinone oxidoreductase subunit L
MDVVTWIGASSAVIAAIIACTQTDIKRVLAYSTMSQIGYMMFSLGISGYGGEAGAGYTASMFHLFTHAFFKSLLFLCAGIVIHLVHSNDMKDMGGLRKRLPLAHWAFLVACLAIAGIPPLSGFFSKEAILAAAWQSNITVYAIGLITAALTAFYMFRLYFSIFWKNESPVQHANHTPKVSWPMQLPLLVLSICTIIAGLIPFGSYISSDGKGVEAHFEWTFALAPVALSLLAILLAAFLYKNENQRPARWAAALGSIYTLARRKFYVDEAWIFLTNKIIFPFIGRPAAWFDRRIIDGGVNMVASVTGKTSELIKGIQSGRVQNYAIYFFTGAIALAVLIIYIWK